MGKDVPAPLEPERREHHGGVQCCRIGRRQTDARSRPSGGGSLGSAAPARASRPHRRSAARRHPARRADRLFRALRPLWVQSQARRAGLRACRSTAVAAVPVVTRRSGVDPDRLATGRAARRRGSGADPEVMTSLPHSRPQRRSSKRGAAKPRKAATRAAGTRKGTSSAGRKRTNSKASASTRAIPAQGRPGADRQGDRRRGRAAQARRLGDTPSGEPDRARHPAHLSNLLAPDAALELVLERVRPLRSRAGAAERGARPRAGARGRERRRRARLRQLGDGRLRRALGRHRGRRRRGSRVRLDVVGESRAGHAGRAGALGAARRSGSRPAR